MNHVVVPQVSCTSHHSLSLADWSERIALFLNRRASRSENRPSYTASEEKLFVGCIDDGLGGGLSNISLGDFYHHSEI